MLRGKVFSYFCTDTEPQMLGFHKREMEGESHFEKHLRRNELKSL